MLHCMHSWQRNYTFTRISWRSAKNYIIKKKNCNMGKIMDHNFWMINIFSKSHQQHIGKRKIIRCGIFRSLSILSMPHLPRQEYHRVWYTPFSSAGCSIVCRFIFFFLRCTPAHFHQIFFSLIFLFTTKIYLSLLPLLLSPPYQK